jgi:hypothetical protein
VIATISIRANVQCYKAGEYCQDVSELSGRGFTVLLGCTTRKESLQYYQEGNVLSGFKCTNR